jgi:ribosomal protein S18 acetylase RimI-like enzyme
MESNGLSETDGLVAVDPDNPEHVLAAARLHAALLGHSPIPRLGSLFMTRFFYSQLVRDGLVHCFLYRVNGEYVGFLSFTERPYSFMSEGRSAHLLRLAFILGLAVLAKPARWRILFDTATAGRRTPPSDADGVGEFLSFGVLEQFSAHRDSQQGLRIPTVLFDAGIRHFRQRGFRRIEWNVDADNLRAIIFYRSYGATLEKSPLAWPSDYRVRLAL